MKHTTKKWIWALLFIIGVQFSLIGQDIKLETKEWWTSNHLHLNLTLKGQMPSPSQSQAKYFLNFKNKWVIEAEGYVNNKLKNHSLQVESVNVGESNFGGDHTLSAHIILRQVPEANKHKSSNIMAFIYTSESSSKNLGKACKDKLNTELKSFKKDWKVIGNFLGEVSNAQHRTRWEGVIGVK